ncbi:GIY-YIG nuclease family protein [Luteimonas sp. 3794]|uniref:GIY-YIG nuclease family protein n=1 Tax=Luteimonas sp. 3794 TaxID=2817730 RepID=UPI002859E31E|nr:GIY-YIG nuclease family protein [Luteimonas sp. 3794]MDR6993306.1 putative endonuclease [Luteimonas sp. 3794]
MERNPCVYLLARARNGTLYLGVTSNLAQRVWQHRTSVIDGFSARYDTHHLVWFERHETMPSAIAREKQIKKWRRAWKVDLIESANPYWRDLWSEIIG